MAKTKTAGNAGCQRLRASSSEGGRQYQCRRIDAKNVSLDKKYRKAGNDDQKISKVTSGYERSARLSHDTEEKRDESRLRLHITKTRREIDELRERLEAWDEVEERRKEREAERKRKAEEVVAAEGGQRKKRVKPGPEKWKLRGAARPAWEVYDFDTRYVCPHAKAHDEAREKARRVQNVLSLYRGRFGEEGGDNDDDDVPPQPYCRRYLSLLMQLGHLCVEAKKLKSAREAFLECIELEGMEPDSVVITMARGRLMRMYMEANRPASARRLWERLPYDQSAWIRYSAALIEFVSWKLLKEDGSSAESAEEMLRKAIGANKFCAYYIAFHANFEKVVEYGDEIEDSDPGTFLEAIEYCNSEQMGSWIGTEGAIEWVKGIILQLLHEQPNDDGGWVESTRAHLESWERDLVKIEVAYSEKSKSKNRADEASGDGGRSDEEEPDVAMYAGMFRTAMDMLQDTGDIPMVVEGGEKISAEA